MTSIEFKDNKNYQALRDCEPGFYIRDDMKVIFNIITLAGQKYFTCIFVDGFISDKLYPLKEDDNVDVIPISIDKVICSRKLENK